jgi:phi13 family phage major tail protein
MSTVLRKPPIKESIGAQYICFNKMDEDDQWTQEFEEEVEKTETVKSVSVSENASADDVYASGKVYDNESSTATYSIESEVIAFADETLAKMKGDSVDKGGLILSGGNRTKPYFAYGKVVMLKGGKVRLDWYPKCKLTENSDETKTKEESYSEQTDKITITAYPFNEDGDIVAKVSSEVNFPDGLSEEKFFAAPILTKEDLAKAIGAKE